MSKQFTKFYEKKFMVDDFDGDVLIEPLDNAYEVSLLIDSDKGLAVDEDCVIRLGFKSSSGVLIVHR